MINVKVIKKDDMIFIKSDNGLSFIGDVSVSIE